MSAISFPSAKTTTFEGPVWSAVPFTITSVTVGINHFPG
jgi:hypothetical protein